MLLVCKQTAELWNNKGTPSAIYTSIKLKNETWIFIPKSYILMLNPKILILDDTLINEVSKNILYY